MRIIVLSGLLALTTCHKEEEKKNVAPMSQAHESCACGDHEEKEAATQSATPQSGTSPIQIIEASTNEHAHHAPHGGEVKTVGSLHLEMVWGRDEEITLYILDGRLLPAQPSSANGSAITNNGERFSLSYDGLLSKLSGRALADELTVEVTISDKLYRAKFNRSTEHKHHH